MHGKFFSQIFAKNVVTQEISILKSLTTYDGVTKNITCNIKVIFMLTLFIPHQ